MDFVRLGPAHSTAYYPDVLIEGYNSLIWNERFMEHGEFELKSFDVDGMLALLPEDTLVSHLETQEVMIVESHEIATVGEGADAQPEITIKGRSATIILDHRWVESSYQKKRRMRRRYTATGAASVLLSNAVDNASGKDITRGDTDPDTKIEHNDYSWNTLDVIPNVAVTDSAPQDGPLRWWLLEEGPLYPQLQKILQREDLSVRCLRPVKPTPGIVVTVKSALADRGTIVRTSKTNVTQLRFDIYQGIDRSSSVQFSMLQGHLDAPHYLASNNDHKTGIELMSGEIAVGDVYRAGQEGLTGWERKIMGFDAGTPEIPDAPEKPEELKKSATRAQREARADAMDKWLDDMAKWRNKRSLIVADFREEQTEAARRELRNHRRTNVFSADISQLSPYKYKIHYDLGDTVMLFGDYGKKTKMVVGEYVRTEDENGERGFPGLVEP